MLERSSVKRTRLKWLGQCRRGHERHLDLFCPHAVLNEVVIQLDVLRALVEDRFLASAIGDLLSILSITCCRGHSRVGNLATLPSRPRIQDYF